MNILRGGLLLLIIASDSCQYHGPLSRQTAVPLVAHRASIPIQIDGQSGEPSWKQAEPLALDIPRDLRQQGQALEESGQARLLWDDQFLYIAFDLIDSDIVALGTADDQEHHQLGDVAEVFLKPAEQTWYWEFHVTPAGLVSTYWHAGRGRYGLLVDAHVRPRFIQAATQAQGTLNDDRDRDHGWTAEMAIPWSKLDRRGERADPKTNWTILIARCNYTRYRLGATGPELSSAPVLPTSNYHLIEDYAPLKLVP